MEPVSASGVPETISQAGPGPLPFSELSNFRRRVYKHRALTMKSLAAGACADTFLLLMTITPSQPWTV